jgi:phage protein D/phage baseplate assembly protein gpV
MSDQVNLGTQFVIKVEGQSVDETIITNLVEVTVDQNVHLPGMFTIHVFDSDFAIVDGATFGLGKTVEISAGDDSEKLVTLIEGEITSIEPIFGRVGTPECLIRGYDKSHRLHREVKSATFLDIKDSDLATKIASNAGLASQVTKTKTVYEHVFQTNQTDFEFLQQRAWRIGYEFYVQDDKLHFKEPPSVTSANVTLEWNVDLLAFYPRMTLAEQVDEVNVRGWDSARQQAIVGKATSGKLYPKVGESKNGAKLASQHFREGVAIIVDQPVVDQSEANELAKARLNELSGAFIKAEGVAYRRPQIRAGEVVELKKVGKRFSGKYLVTNALHTYSLAQGLETTFQVQGARSGLLANSINPQTGTDRWYGVYPAVVTNVDDKENKEGRVRVKYPWLTDTDESWWARVVYPGAGKLTGFYAPPSVNDEVLVAFEQGDFNRPIVIGGLWSAKNSPLADANPKTAYKDGKCHLRQWRTTYGHHMTMHESAETKLVEIETKSGHRFALDEKEKKIEIRTSGGILIEMDDGSKKITIKGSDDIIINANKKIDVKANTSIKMTCGGSTLELKPGGATLKATKIDVKSQTTTTVEGTATVNVKASGPVNVKGAIINLN